MLYEDVNLKVTNINIQMGHDALNEEESESRSSSNESEEKED